MSEPVIEKRTIAELSTAFAHIGAGPPVLLLHGLPPSVTPSTCWICPALAQAKRPRKPGAWRIICAL